MNYSLKPTQMQIVAFIAANGQATPRQICTLSGCDSRGANNRLNGLRKSGIVKNTGKLLPWRTAAECIDWSLECPSIFDRKRPLAENTLKRIARGIQRLVTTPDRHALITSSTSLAVDGYDEERAQQVVAFLREYCGPEHDGW